MPALIAPDDPRGWYHYFCAGKRNCFGQLRLVWSVVYDKTGDEHCLGCGDSLPKGSYRRLFSSCNIVLLWKDLIREILGDQGLELGQIGRRYVCRKCLHSYEGYVASKSKLLAGL